jgi:hypothetical protein
MLYAREPSDEEMQELKRMMQQEVGRVSQRAHMVVLSIHRKGVPEIAQLFETCRALLDQAVQRRRPCRAV